MSTTRIELRSARSREKSGMRKGRVRCVPSARGGFGPGLELSSRTSPARTHNGIAKKGSSKATITSIPRRLSKRNQTPLQRAHDPIQIGSSSRCVSQGLAFHTRLCGLTQHNNAPLPKNAYRPDSMETSRNEFDSPASRIKKKKKKGNDDAEN